MAIVEVRTRAAWIFHCPVCDEWLIEHELGDVAYEGHDRCFTGNSELVDQARAAGYSDIYGFMCDQIELDAIVLCDLLAPSLHARTTNRGPSAN